MSRHATHLRRLDLFLDGMQPGPAWSEDERSESRPLPGLTASVQNENPRCRHPDGRARRTGRRCATAGAWHDHGVLGDELRRRPKKDRRRSALNSGIWPEARRGCAALPRAASTRTHPGWSGVRAGARSDRDRCSTRARRESSTRGATPDPARPSPALPAAWRSSSASAATSAPSAKMASRPSPAGCRARRRRGSPPRSTRTPCARSQSAGRSVR